MTDRPQSQSDKFEEAARELECNETRRASMGASRSPGHFALIALSWLLILIVTANLLNLTGDCAPNVTDCGGFQRRLSSLVLAFGLIGLGFYAYSFARSRR